MFGFWFSRVSSFHIHWMHVFSSAIRRICAPPSRRREKTGSTLIWFNLRWWRTLNLIYIWLILFHFQFSVYFNLLFVLDFTLRRDWPARGDEWMTLRVVGLIEPSAGDTDIGLKREGIIGVAFVVSMQKSAIWRWTLWNLNLSISLGTIMTAPCKRNTCYLLQGQTKRNIHSPPNRLSFQHRRYHPLAPSPAAASSSSHSSQNSHGWPFEVGTEATYGTNSSSSVLDFILLTKRML